MEDKKQELIAKLKERDVSSDIINDLSDSSLTNIHNLYFKDEFKEPETGVEMVFVARYYRYVEEKVNDELAKKYYLMAAELGNSWGMYGLAYFYEQVEKNYELAKKYYLMAIERGNPDTGFNLGLFYGRVEQNNELVKKYYLIAIELKNEKAMNNLGVYYEEVENNLKLAKSYYLMAIKFGNERASSNLGMHYETKGKLGKALKFYMLHPERNMTEIMKILNCKDNALAFFAKHKSLKDQVKHQQLEIEHLKFKPGGPEFKKAKSHFETLAFQ